MNALNGLTAEEEQGFALFWSVDQIWGRAEADFLESNDPGLLGQQRKLPKGWKAEEVSASVIDVGVFMHDIEITRGFTEHPLSMDAREIYHVVLDSETGRDRIKPLIFSIDESGVFELEFLAQDKTQNEGETTPAHQGGMVEPASTLEHIVSVVDQIATGRTATGVLAVRYEIKFAQVFPADDPRTMVLNNDRSVAIER